MSFHTTLAIYMAFRCMWYAPKLSILTQLTYFVLLSQCLVTKHLQQVWPTDGANPPFCFSQVPRSVLSPSWLYYRIIRSTFRKDPVGTLLRCSLTLQVRETDIKKKKTYRILSMSMVCLSFIFILYAYVDLFFIQAQKLSGLRLPSLVFSGVFVLFCFVFSQLLVQNCS